MGSQNHLRWYLKCKLCRFAFYRLLIILVLCLGIGQSIGYAQTPKEIKVGTIVAKPGTKISGILEVPKGVDQGTIIPVTIINGSKSGPVLTLIAGIHGTEYVPIITLQRILAILDPKDISGTIIMVHIANVTSFKDRRIYYNPVDGKNLNRQFPGNKAGTITERIANIITSEVINKSDYLIDLHGGELNENIIHYCSLEYNCPDYSVGEKTKFLAHSFGGYYILPEAFNSVPDSVKYTYCHLTALRKGVPAIFVESGGHGDTDIGSILYMEQGITNVLKALKIIKGEVIESKPVYLSLEIMVTSNVEGLFYSTIDCGQIVAKGSLIGYVTDYFGKHITDFYSPLTGIVEMSYSTPVVNKGEDLFYISEIKDAF
jgi:predicted deacylase